MGAQKATLGRLRLAGADGVAATGRTNGAPVTFTKAGTVPSGTSIVLGGYTDRPELAEMVVLIAQQLEAVGFTVKQDVREYAQIEADALAGAFDCFLLSRATVLDSGDPVAYMVSDFSSTGSFSLSLLADDAVDAALAKRRHRGGRGAAGRHHGRRGAHPRHRRGRPAPPRARSPGRGRRPRRCRARPARTRAHHLRDRCRLSAPAP